MMDIRDMHYDFAIKYNKVDSNGNEHLEIPEIDWLLNEAQEMYIRNIAEPFSNKFHGFELNQRTIDSISPIVKTEDITIVSNSYAELPEDYFFYVNGIVTMSRGKCLNKTGLLLIKQHDDEFLFDSFQKSSFEWRELVANFEERGLVIYPEDFIVNKIALTYLKKPEYLHNAEDFNPGGGYELPSGKSLLYRSHCIFKEDVCKDIVDIAVMLAAQNTGIVPKYNLKMNKLKIKQIYNE